MKPCTCGLSVASRGLVTPPADSSGQQVLYDSPRLTAPYLRTPLARRPPYPLTGREVLRLPSYLDVRHDHLVGLEVLRGHGGGQQRRRGAHRHGGQVGHDAELLLGLRFVEGLLDLRGGGEGEHRGRLGNAGYNTRTCNEWTKFLFVI